LEKQKTQTTDYNAYHQYTGFLIWKTQNPWLGLRGQMYDWLLEPTAALYGIRCATEAVHVQLCPRQGGVIQVCNTTSWHKFSKFIAISNSCTNFHGKLTVENFCQSA
jgi:hypothetical protein